MKKSLLLLLLCAGLLTGCDNASEPAVSSETMTVSQTQTEPTEFAEKETESTEDISCEVTETGSDMTSSEMQPTVTTTEVPQDAVFSTETTMSISESERETISSGNDTTETIAPETQMTTEVTAAKTTTVTTTAPKPKATTTTAKQTTVARTTTTTTTITTTVQKNNNSSEENYKEFLAALGQRESSSNYLCKNDFGYLGMWQMYPTSSLADAGYTDISGNWTEYANKNGVYNETDFLNNKDAQYDAVTQYHKANWRYLEYYEGADYIGTYYNGVKITESGLLAAAHLVGGKGMSEALINGTSIEDAYGTDAAEYLQMFAGYDISYIKN